MFIGKLIRWIVSDTKVHTALVEKFTTQLFYAQSIPVPNPIPNPNPITNHNPIANPIPNPALVELTRRLTEID